MKYIRPGLLLCLALVFIFTLGCGRDEQYPYIALHIPEKQQNIKQNSKDKAKVLKIGMSTGMGYENGILNNESFTQAFSAATGLESQVTLRNSLSEINNLLAFGVVDVAITYATAYLWDKHNYHLEALAISRPPADGASENLIIMPVKSSVRSLYDLQGKTFAMTDPLSSAGGMYVYYLLNEINERPETFFKNFFYTANYEHTVDAVVTGMVEGAAVRNHTLTKMAKQDPALMQKLKIVGKSPPVEELVVIVRAEMNKDLKHKIQEAVLTMADDPDQENVLHALHIGGFRPVTGQDFIADAKIVKKVMHR